MMKYKGYMAKIEFDDKAEIFHGEVANLKDVITFQGKSVTELKTAFKDSVDDYLEFCKERKESLASVRAKMSMNLWIKETLKKAVNS